MEKPDRPNRRDLDLDVEAEEPLPADEAILEDPVEAREDEIGALFPAADSEYLLLSDSVSSPIAGNQAAPPERKAFEQEAFPLMSMLFRTALRLTRNQHDAEDLVQNAVLRAYNFYDKFQPGTSFKAWIFKIMTNIFINDYHKHAKEPPLVPIENQMGFEPDPEKSFFDNLLDEDIKKAIEELPEAYRLTFLLASEGFSYKEISTITGANLGTVMSRLYRARRLLQSKLWEYAGGGVQA